MPAIDLVVETELSRSGRVRQLEAIFDVPAAQKSRLEWKGELPIEEKDWNVGLIVGPSGAGKSSVARHVFGAAVDVSIAWRHRSVIDDFASHLSLEQIAEVCQAVGFNTIPAWMRPFSVLSNGERFRVELARRLVELPDPIVVDEFSSVVDRQVAKIASHACQKWVRKHGRRFVAVSCHRDIVDWLQPDWIFEPAIMAYTPRRRLQRPQVKCVIGRIPRSAWIVFRPYHYMSASLHPGARCFGLWADGTLAAFLAVIQRAGFKGMMACSRVVTLPDWQGLGLAFALVETVASAYSAVEKTFRNYPAHPSYVRAHDRSPNWILRKRPGVFQAKQTDSRMKPTRPCAVFEYCGPVMERRNAELLLAVG